MWRIHESLKCESKHEVLDSIWTAKTIMFKNNLTTKYFHIYRKLKHIINWKLGLFWRGHLDQIWGEKNNESFQYILLIDDKSLFNSFH